MCSCLYSNFIKEYLSFLFSIIFKFVIFFSDFIFIYTSTLTLFLSSYEFLLCLNKYTLYSTWIRNSLSGRKLNTIRLLISTSLFCKILMINVRVEEVRIQHDVCTFINRIYITRACKPSKVLTACLTHWPIAGGRGPSLVNI